MSKKIVFIEDEPALQKSLGSFLRQEGYHVSSALDGETGLKLVKTQKPDLVLLDIILPKMDGFEVLKELKEDEETKDIPILILTNLERMKDVEQALVTGATSYLIKTDYDLKELAQKIKEAIK